MESKLYGEVGRLGFVVPIKLLTERLGGNKQLLTVLNTLTVIEKITLAKPKGMAKKKCFGFKKMKIGGQDMLILPRSKITQFSRWKTVSGVPHFNKIITASTHLPDGSINPNAPLPLPRKLEEARLISAEPLYDYQEAAVSYLCDSDQKIVYLQMDTGLGKSRVGCSYIARRGEPAIIIVPTDAIANQWVEEFAEIYPLMKVIVYHNVSSKSNKIAPNAETYDVIVIIINTFRDKTPDFLSGFGTMVLDETHEYYSDKNSKALWLCQTGAVLGLSATPLERKDGLDKYICLHLGNVLYPANIPGFDVNAVKFCGLARIVEYAGHPDYCETIQSPTGMMSAIMTIGNFIQDKYRINVIISEIERLYYLHETAPENKQYGIGPRPISDASEQYPAGQIRRHGIFVFAEHRDYLSVISQGLECKFHPDDIIAPELSDNKISILRGGVAKNAVNEARKAGAHIVLTTYGFSRRGISLPEMTSIILATPRRNGLRQIIGRILRMGSDESIVRQVIDIVDIRTGLRGQLTDRKKIYIEKNYPITKTSALWSDYASDLNVV